MNSVHKLTKAEQAVLALFATKRNEDGRVQVWTIPECKAAWKLTARGLASCEFVESSSRVFDRGAYGRWTGGTTVTQSGAVNVRLTEKGVQNAVQS